MKICPNCKSEMIQKEVNIKDYTHITGCNRLVWKCLNPECEAILRWDR